MREKEEGRGGQGKAWNREGRQGIGLWMSGEEGMRWKKGKEKEGRRRGVGGEIKNVLCAVYGVHGVGCGGLD